MSIQEKDSREQMCDFLETYYFHNSLNDYYYTSYSEDVTIDGNTYQAVPIQRSTFDKNLEDGTVKVNITAPITTAFYQFVASFPVYPTTVRIRRYYMDDYTEFALVFNGKINAISISKHTATAECLSSMNELNAKVPGVYIQSYCNNVLYGDVCQAHKIADPYEIIVDPNDNAHLTLVTSSILPDNFYTLGECQYNSEPRLITKQTGNEIYLHFPYRNINTGDTVNLFAGCDKTPETCHNVHGNIDNFVGMYFVPKPPNPVNWGVV